MDKNAIKKYAVWARRELITRVSQRAAYYGITEKNIVDADAASIDGRILSSAEKKQRQALIGETKAKGYEQVMEAVAYTWFNRFTALRFLEVNGYLPAHVRVFTDDDNNFKPQILTEAINLDLDGLNMEKVYALKNANDNDELFKYLVITQCSALNACLPGMFQKIEDYTELLFPDNLLRDGSVIEQMITLIPEADWQDQVQIIGWLYQYYNAEPKDKVFENLKKNIKISKENIPAATQLFTPDWIVRYMVENSLGRLWVEGHPNDELKANWKYYLEEAEQEPEVQAQLNEIRKEYAALKPENIKVIDPCMGSGHILVYMFDVLVQIYESYGYGSREAVGLILQNNLYGLDIDDRAAQLAYFAVMMKARQYDRRIFSRGIQPHVYAIVESNGITTAPLHDMGLDLTEEEYEKAVKQTLRLIDEMHDAKEYGSILNITPCDWALLRRFAVPRGVSEGQIMLDIHGEQEAAKRLQEIINVAEALSQKYDIVVTNPPYMGASGMGSKLSDYVKKNYPDSKSDLFAVFIERCGAMTAKNGYQAMITQHAWMFLSSFEKLREKLLKTDTVNMAHLGARAFEEIGGEVVQTTSFVFRKSNVADYKGTYCRLIEPTTQQGKEDMFLSGKNRFSAQQSNFSKIHGSPVAYWVSERMFRTFIKGTPVASISKGKSGQNTGDNTRFLRLWNEVNSERIGFNLPQSYNGAEFKWIPYNKGGEFRRWYGNIEFVVNWENDGKEIKDYAVIRNNGKHWSRYIQNLDCLYKEGITWSIVTASTFSMRYLPAGCICDYAGCSVFPTKELNHYLLGLFNTKFAEKILGILNPTINYQPGNIGSVPYIYKSQFANQINDIVNCNIEISKSDWDSYETSWDFKRNPLI